MKREPDHPISIRCDACGSHVARALTTSRAALARVFVVVVACAQCRTPFVVLSRN